MAIKQILSPLPGTFYRAPGAGQADLQGTGRPVAAGDVVGLVEVMKTFYEVKSDGAGKIVQFLVENEEAVLAGQPLAEIEV